MNAKADFFQSIHEMEQVEKKYSNKKLPLVNYGIIKAYSEVVKHIIAMLTNNIML